MTNQSNTISQLAILREYVDNYKLGEGSDFADHLLELEPNNIEAMIEKITLWFTWGMPFLVYKEGVKIHELAPGSAADLFARVTTDPDGPPVNALDLLDQALELDPTFERAWFARGMILFEQKQYTEAIKSFDRALLLSPKHAISLSRDGLAKSFTKDYWGAALDLTNYIHTPEFGDRDLVFVTLAECFLRLAVQDLEVVGPRITPLRAGNLDAEL